VCKICSPSRVVSGFGGVAHADGCVALKRVNSSRENRSLPEERLRIGEKVDRWAAGAALLMEAAVGGVVSLYEATRSLPVTLIGFGLAGCITGWYLWVRRGPGDTVQLQASSSDVDT
jgi:hypothetical protein